MSLLPVPIGVYRTRTPLGEVAAACAWCEDWGRFSLTRTRRTAHVALLPTRLRWDAVLATCEACGCAVEAVEDGWDPAPPGACTLAELLGRAPEEVRAHGGAMLERLAAARGPGAQGAARQVAMADVLNAQAVRLAPVASRRAWEWRWAVVLVLLLAAAGGIGGVLLAAGIRGSWAQSGAGSVITAAAALGVISGVLFAVERRTSRRWARLFGERLARFRPSESELEALWERARREPRSPARVVWLRHLKRAMARRDEPRAAAR